MIPVGWRGVLPDRFSSIRRSLTGRAALAWRPAAREYDDDGTAQDQPARWVRARNGSRIHSGGCRRRYRPRPRQGGDRGARGWRIAGHQPPLRWRCRTGAGDEPRRGRCARTRAPRLRPRPGRSGPVALSRNADHLRPFDRRWFLLRRQGAGKPRPVLDGRSARDRGGDAPHHPRRQAAEARGLEPRAADREVGKRRRGLQGRMGEGTARERGADGLLERRGLARHVPWPASRLHRQARPRRLQADARRGRILARRPVECAADAHLRHRLAQQEAVEGPSHAAGRSRQTRSPQAGPRDGPVPSAGRGARIGLLASQGLSHLARARSLYAPQDGQWRLSRNQDAAADGRAPVGTVRPLGQICREHVRGARHGARSRR